VAADLVTTPGEPPSAARHQFFRDASRAVQSARYMASLGDRCEPLRRPVPRVCLELKAILAAPLACFGYLSRSQSKEATMRFISKLLRDDSGATAIEYGLIAALISVVIIGAVTLVGSHLSATFNSIATALASAS